MHKAFTVEMPSVHFPERVWKRLLAYIDRCPMEVGGIGTVEHVGDMLIVSQIFLLAQNVSPSIMLLDPEAVQRFLEKWDADGKDTTPLRFFWHSHATSSTEWSGMDHKSMELLSRNNWTLSFVGNHRHEWRLRFTTQEPFPIAIDHVPCIVIPEFDPALVKDIEEEVRMKVRPITKERESVLHWGGRLLSVFVDDRPRRISDHKHQFGRDDDFTD